MLRSFLQHSARPALITVIVAAFGLHAAAGATAIAGGETPGRVGVVSVIAMLTSGFMASKAAAKRQVAPIVDAPGQGQAEAGTVARTPDPRKALPQACDFILQEGAGQATYFDRACLVGSFNYWPFLPDRCEKRVDGPDHTPIQAYEGRCLALFGYAQNGQPPSVSHR